jgi:(1->4)-alpha-D-glucan 1-alpha-D-glucosylmutase
MRGRSCGGGSCGGGCGASTGAPPGSHPIPVYVEKILEPGEQLPGWWATEGTTGYDALGEIDRVLTDPGGL